MPADLQAALAGDRAAAAAFGRQSYTHQREYVIWIEEPRRAEKRARRIARALEMLTRYEAAGE